MNTLATRFPSDLSYDVFFDTTVFVTATIDEVIRTLVEAIVLVALVVFLFLGKLRTTLIPLVAVPVSIVGTFAVMLAIGYTANTVSLLALVLAIGIVVDDAIVVVENVERVIEEEPELSIPDACKKAMAGDHRPDPRHHLRAAVGVRPGRVHSRHQRPAVPPVRGRGLGVHAHLGAQCADPEPGALRGAARSAATSTRGPMRYVLGAIDRVRDGYVSVVRRLVRVSIIGVVVVAGVVAASVRPVQPAAAELPARRRTRARSSPRCAFRKAPRSTAPRRSSSRSRISSGRFPASKASCRWSGSTSSTTSPRRTRRSSSSASSPTRSAPIRRRARARSSRACVRSSRRSGAPSRSRSTCRRSSGSAAPAASNTCSRRCRDSRRRDIAAALRALVVAANQQPELAGVYSTYAADTPQIYLDINRDKAQVLGVKITDIFNALQSTLGSFYVNDFNVFGRTWQVNIQADTPFRDQPTDIDNIYVRNAQGAMVPIAALAQARLVQGPQMVVRYNGYRAAIVNGAPKPGFSSGVALAAMERISATTLPAGYSYEWTATALQEKAASGQTGIVLGLAVLFAYLFLVALYESWNIPIPGAAVGQRRRAGRDRRAGAGRDAVSTSMPRSASSC